MTEIKQGMIPLISFGFVLLACYCYMLAGRGDAAKYHIGKWLRRYISPAFITLGAVIPAILIGNFKWYLFLIYPLFVLQFISGYGSLSFWTRIQRRAIIVLLNMIPLLLLAFAYHNFWLMPLAIPFASLSIYLGIKNPFSPAIEEFLVCFLLSFPITLYPFLI